MTTVSMADGVSGVVVGVDTHADVHVAAALDLLGRHLGTLEIATTTRGYEQLLRWARAFGRVRGFGVEGTGSYGAGLARHLAGAGCTVTEINRPDRRARRGRGKSDPLDAEAAARAVLAGAAQAIPKADQDQVGMIRTLRVARRSAMKMRIQVSNQMAALVVTAPAPLRDQLRHLSLAHLVGVCATLRPGAVSTPTAASRLALRSLALRHQGLCTELEMLDRELARLTREAAPALIDLTGVGPDVAGALLVAAGDNPNRLRSDFGFRKSLWRIPCPRVVRENQPTPSQPGWRSHRQQRALAHRHGPAYLRRPHPGIRGATHRRRHVQARDHSLSEALRRSRSLPCPA